MNELRWIEWIEVKWVNWWNWLRITLWESPYGQLKVSLSKWLEWKWFDQTLSKWMESMRNEWIEWIEPFEVKWVNWRKWLGTTLWESPYESREVNPMEVTGMNPMRKSLSKWSESMRNEWIEVNRVNRGKMSDLKDLTWNPFKVTWVNSVGISLWVENECPYQSDLRWVIWPNPIKMNGIDEKWMNWGE